MTNQNTEDQWNTIRDFIMAKEKSVINTQALKKFMNSGGIEKMFKKGKGKSETLDIKDPDFMDKVIRQMKVGKKAGGKVMKMRGGGMATQGTKFSIKITMSEKNKKQDPSKIYFGYDAYGNKGPFTEEQRKKAQLEAIACFWFKGTGLTLGAIPAVLNF